MPTQVGRPTPNPPNRVLTEDRQTKRRTAIDNFFKMVKTPLAMLGSKDVAFALDGVAITMCQRDLTEAVLEIADEVKPVGTFLDKASKAGPFGKLLEALVPLAAQIATNHSILPAQLQDALGVIPKQALIDELERRNTEEQERAEEVVSNGDAPVRKTPQPQQS